MLNLPVVGDVVNFNIEEPATTPNNRLSVKKTGKTGKVEHIFIKDDVKIFQVKIKNKQEYHQIQSCQIIHIWEII